MTVLTRERWNDIVRSINTLAANPDSGCDPLPPLEEVPPQSKWRKSDIEAAQNLLAQVCNENTFSPMPAKWKASIIEELQTAISRGWCGCEDDDECGADDEAAAQAEDGVQYTVLSLVTTLYSNCPPYSPVPPNTSVAALIGGLQLGVAGFAGRTWRLHTRTNGVDSPTTFASGTVNCRGEVVVGFNRTIQPWIGLVVTCGCSNPSCQESLANAAASLSGTQVDYILTLSAATARCVDCD